MASLRASESWPATSIRMIDSGWPEPSRPSSAPSASRRTRMTGWMTWFTVRPSAPIVAVTLSTRNGMSSLTISTTAWPGRSPGSRRTCGVPCGRRCAKCQMDKAAPGSRPRRSASETRWKKARTNSVSSPTVSAPRKPFRNHCSVMKARGAAPAPAEMKLAATNPAKTKMWAENADHRFSKFPDPDRGRPNSRAGRLPGPAGGPGGPGGIGCHATDWPSARDAAGRLRPAWRRAPGQRHRLCPGRAGPAARRSARRRIERSAERAAERSGAQRATLIPFARKMAGSSGSSKA